MKVEDFGRGKQVVFNCDNFKETIRFSPHKITSTRSEYLITQEWGLNEKGETSRDFIPFAEGSIEQILIEVVKTGQIDKITERGLILNERPLKGEISRNLSVYDPETNLCYTIGGLGLLKPTKDDVAHFTLSDPELKTIYSDYQGKRGGNVGGTCLVTDDGFNFVANKSKIGTMEYNSGPYHIIRKIEETIKLRKLGIHSPQFIAAGPIHNLDEGKFGFTIYRSHLAPEYLLNIHLYLDKQGGFSPLYESYINSKYQQFGLMHFDLKESHGQPTITNTPMEFIKSGNEMIFKAQIKDFETNHPIPSNTAKTITESICEMDIGKTVKKSPQVAAMSYDLQLAITQELNIMFIPLQSAPSLEVKINYIAARTQDLIKLILKAYGLEPQNTSGIINFTINNFVNAIKNGHKIEEYNRILGGLIAHAIFGFSKAYGDQIEVS